MIWLLRLFPQFRELDALVQMQAEKVQEFENLEAKTTDLVVENQSLTQDISNLQEANQELVNEKLRLEDRLEAMTTDRDKLWDTMQDAIHGERYAYQTMVNHAVQKNGGGIPFPDSHSLPPAEVRKIQAPGPIGRAARILPSELAARNTSQFVQGYVARMDPNFVEPVLPMSTPS